MQSREHVKAPRFAKKKWDHDWPVRISDLCHEDQNLESAQANVGPPLATLGFSLYWEEPPMHYFCKMHVANEKSIDGVN